MPPYSPELNPVEHIWDDLREKYFHNRAFDSLDALEDHLVVALQIFEADSARVKSITAWPWINEHPRGKPRGINTEFKPADLQSALRRKRRGI